LRDAGAGDAAIRTHEQHRIGVDVEPRFECACPVADHHDVGVVMAGPVKLGHRARLDKVGPQCLPAHERLVAEYGAQVVAPAQHREAGPEHLVEQHVLCVAGVDARLDEQRAGWRGVRGLAGAWLGVYHNAEKDWDLYEFAERLVDLDHKFQLWRCHHLKTVERIIGYKPGTGGTGGVSYLAKALELKFFPELWLVRTSM